MRAYMWKSRNIYMSYAKYIAYVKTNSLIDDQIFASVPSCGLWTCTV